MTISLDSANLIRQIDQSIARLPPDDQELVQWFEQYAGEHKYRIAEDLGHVLRIAPPSAKLVDLGALPFLLTAALAALGRDVTGVDIDPARFQRSIDTLSLRIVQADLEKDALPFDDETFDVAIFNEVFEHLRINPIATFREVLRILRPGGRLMLTTPNFLSPHRLLPLLLTGKSGADVYPAYAKLESVGHMGHVREYTGREVGEFLESMGMNIEQVSYRWYRVPRETWFRRVGRLIPFAPGRVRPMTMIIARKP